MNALASAVLVVAIGLAHAKINVEVAEKRFNLCKEETGAEEKFDDVILKEHIPTSDKGMCLARCLLKENGIFNEEGVFNLEGTKEYFNGVFSHKPENIEKSVAIAEECSKIDVKDLDKCEASVKHLTCVRAKAIQQNIKLND